MPAGLAGVGRMDWTEEPGGRDTVGVGETQVIQAPRIVGLDLGQGSDEGKKKGGQDMGKRKKLTRHRPPGSRGFQSDFSDIVHNLQLH